MTANKKIAAAVFKSALLLLLIGFQSCGTYNSKTTLEADLYSGNFDAAITNIDQNKFLQKDRNKLLYFMEKGKLEHLRGNYENSNALFEQAYIMIDDRIKTNAGQAIAAKFTNPMAEPYKGEDFEKVSIHYYMALNYFMLGMSNEALVEAKRINIKLIELNEKYPENKNRYSEDAFSQILQGLIYESTGDINNAFIAYRNAEEIFNRGDGRFFGTRMPDQLKKDLIRTAGQMGFREEYDAYMKKYMPQAEAGTKKNQGAAPLAAKAEGEAVIFWENGLGPAKDQIVITASTAGPFFYASYMEGDVLEEIIIPIPTGTNLGSINAIAIPKYRERPSYYSKAAVIANGREYDLELAQDFYPIAKQCLKDRMLRETIDLVLRFAAKKAASAGLGALGKELLGDAGGDLVKLGGDIAGAATEKADTRNWQSLPATISYTRVPLKEGDNKFLIKKYGPNGIIDTDTLTIPFKRGLQIVNYFDLGRTQIMPNVMESLAGASNPLIGAASHTQAQTYPSSDAGTKSIPIPSRLKPVQTEVTPQTVIDKYIAAMGGDEALRNVQTTAIKTTSHTIMGGQTTTSETLIKQNSNNDSFTQVSTDGKITLISVVNSEGGYMIDDRGKRTKMDKTTYKMLRSQPKFHDNLSLPLKSADVKLEGIASYNNEEAYVISYTEQTSKSPMKNYYSVSSGLLLGTTVDFAAGGVSFSMAHNFSDYRNVNGIMYPFKTTTITDDMTSESVVTEFKINEGVYDTDFQ